MEPINWQVRPKSSKCPHSIRSYGFNRFLERIRSWSPLNGALSCQECEKEEMGKSSKKRKEVTAGAKFLWVCLDCDWIFCGTENLGHPRTHIHSHAVKKNHLFAIPIAAWCVDCKSIQQFTTMETNKELNSAIIIKKGLGRMRQGDFDNLPGDYVVRPLKNLGNTCYFNAILQILLSMSVLRANFYPLRCQKRSVTHDLQTLFLDTEVIDEDDVGLMGHVDLLDSIRAEVPKFRGRQEHDSHELLRELLSLLLNEGNSFIEDIFGGKLSSTVSCVQCGNASKSSEPFLDLSLAIPSNECSTKNDEVGTPRDPVPSAMEISSYPSKDISSLLERLSKETYIVPMNTENVVLPSQFSDVMPNVPPRKRPRLEGQAQSGNNNGDPLSIEKCLDLFIEPEIICDVNICPHCSNRSQDHPQTELQSTSKNEKFKEGEGLGGDEVMGAVKPAVESEDKGVDAGSRMPVRAADRFRHYMAIIREANDEPMTEVESKEGVDVGSGMDKEKAMVESKEEGVDVGSGMDEEKTMVESEGEGVDVGSRKAEMKASKRYLILKAPRVLTIHLKRFTVYTKGITKKISSHVNFQEVLDLTPYMDPSCEDKEKPLYRLIGVVVHVGASPMVGHYVAFVRGVQSPGHELAWFGTSDDVVQKVSLKDVLDSEAYVLFYERMQS